MVIPTFERSLDLLMDNEFELSDNEIEQLYQLIMRDNEVISNIEALIHNINAGEMDTELLKNTLKDVINTNSSIVEDLYEKIIRDKKVILYIQEIILKRLLD